MTSVDLTSDARELRRCSQVMLIAVVAGTGSLVVADHPVTTGAWVLPTRRIRLWSDIAGSAAQVIAELGYEHSTLHRLGIVRDPSAGRLHCSPPPSPSTRTSLASVSSA